MKPTFEEILDSLLKAYENGGGKDMDTIIAEKTKEFELSEDGAKTLSETNTYLEAYNKLYLKLKESGKPRSQWLPEELYRIAKENNLSDEQTEQLMVDFAAQCENSKDEIVERGE